MQRTSLPSALGLLLAAALPAQGFDLIGVTFAGQVLRIDSTSGATQVLANGQIGKNGLAFDEQDRLWTTVRSGTTGAFQYHLAIVDPFTGAETLPFGTANVGDLRGMTIGDSGELLAIRDGSPSDQLVRIDLSTGVVTAIGATGLSGLQALDDTVLGLRGWDIGLGLVRIDPTTGAAIDPFPGVVGPAGLQWLATEASTGRLLVGRTTLQDLDLATGTVGPAVAIQGSPDLRGVEFTTPRVTRLGPGCAGVRVGVRFTGGGASMDTTSGPHTPGTLGVQILGLSSASHQGQALPVLLDPLLGTVGCNLWVSIDATRIGFADAQGFLPFPTALPPALDWFPLFVQHAAFDAVPGGISWSDGIRVRTRRQ
jgi:hypothetical protein